MRPLLAAEALKLRTTRTFAVLTGCALALSLTIVVLSATLTDDVTQEDLRQLFSIDFTSLFILLLGVMGMAGEWRHKTITSAVLAAPARIRFLSAKTLSYAAAGAVVSLIVTVTTMLVGTIILGARDKETLDLAELLDLLWRNITVAALLGAFGVCVGGVLRNQIVAIVALLALSFVIEPTVLGLADSVGKFGPTTGLPSGIQDVTGFGGDDVATLSPGPAVLGMLAWIGLGFFASAAMLRKRDLT